MSGSSDIVWVRSREDLRRLAQALAGESAHALDTEANSGFAYQERVCLLQFNVAGRIWLVDLVAAEISGGGIEALRPALEDRESMTFLHGGEFDVGCLKRDFGIHLQGVWDSQQASSLLGWERTGYGVLVENLCGVSLAKQHAFFDWSRRPLPEEVLRYAANDVRYLPEVCRQLRKLVREADLVDEVAIACSAVEQAVWDGEFRPEGFWRLRGAASLTPRAQRILAALYSWRDGVAREADRPAGRVLNNRLLLAISREAPRTLAKLRRLGLPGRLKGERERELLEVVLGALHDEGDLPQPPAKARPRDRASRSRERSLREWRRRETELRKVSEQAVLPAKALEYLAVHGAQNLASVPQLGKRRIERYQQVLQQICSRV